MSRESDLLAGLEARSLDPVAQRRVVAYYSALFAENQVQNLTRLIEPSDFLTGHLDDVLELEKTGWLEGETLDLGSGCGVPGLLSACVNASSRWFLAESEVRKREFLAKTAGDLQIADRVRVGARAEDILRKIPISTVAVRAVGKISKLFSLLHACSTWNTLVLFKGPSWEEEWQEFKANPLVAKQDLEIQDQHRYVVGVESKQRVLVRLMRVPRGTRE